jgi:hypothetical protein
LLRAIRTELIASVEKPRCVKLIELPAAARHHPSL